MATDPHAEIRANVANIDPAWTGELRALLADRDALSDALAAPPADTDPAIDLRRSFIRRSNHEH